MTECPNCRAKTEAAALECPSCGVIFAKWQERQARLDSAAPAAAAAPKPAASSPSGRELDDRQAVVIPAVVFAAAILLSRVELGRFFVHSALSMQIHEFGHALISWLHGRAAVPIPMLTLVLNDEPSVLFGVAVAAALAWSIKMCWDEECYFAAGVLGAILGFQAWLTLIAPAYRFHFLLAFGGLGGECYVAAVLVLLYFHPLPESVRWPNVRVFFLFVGACVLMASLRRWIDASHDFTNVPWGSFWGGDGDVEAMLDSGWTVNRLVDVYLRLAWICTAAVVVEYSRFVWISWQNRAASPGAER